MPPDKEVGPPMQEPDPKTSTPIEDQPSVRLAPVVAIRFLQHTRTVTVRCDFCGERSQHGWPYEDGDDDPGDRISHCWTTRGGHYRVVIQRPGVDYGLTRDTEHLVLRREDGSIDWAALNGKLVTA